MNDSVKDYTLQVWENCDLRSIQVKGYNRRITLYRIGRQDFQQLFKLQNHNLRKDLQSPGLYIFASWEGKRPNWKLYIGKSEQPLRMRLNRHRTSDTLKQSDEVFILPFENYHHINYFEHLFINKFETIVSLWNKQKTTNMFTKNIYAGFWNDAELNRFSLVESEIESLLQILSQNFQALLLKQPKKIKKQSKQSKQTTFNKQDKIYTVQKPRFFVQSRFSGNGKELIVLKGSYTTCPMLFSDKYSKKYQKDLLRYKQMREEMIRTKKIKQVNDKLVFQTDISFATPSAAGNFITGRASNGYSDLNLRQ